MRPRPLFVLSCLALIFVYSGVARTQTSPAASETLRAVEQLARQDAQVGREPTTVQDLIALYGEQAKAEGLSHIEMVNAYRAAYAAAKPPESFWNKYGERLGWVTAVLFFFLFLFRDTVRDVLGPRLKAVGDRLYDRVAGYPVFWWKARGNYRKSLVGLYKRFKIPFMADRYLDMDQIYVPLKVEGASDIDQIADFGEVAHYQRLVVTGQPGSGKSMLLRRLALLHATGGLRKLPDQLTPVLFDLHRLNHDDRGIFEHLVEIFRLHKFPEADSFIKHSLKRGKLMLLFDGLDEVDSDRRAAEVKKLKDFILEHDECRAMVTCRTAVYRGEFDELADRRLEIVDFSDAQIERFLNAWPDMPPNKSVSQLLAALVERPLIKALARRPLLLTIIAFLYTEVEDFRLPHSRADFYKRAAEVLLGGLKGELNKYEAVEKQFVLEHLALYNQTKQAKNEDDRLTLERQTVLGEMRRLLPEMGRKEENAPSMLEEIVERSSLLLPLDNKSRYVFSHLTLQEYFAASALRAKEVELLEHFAADRDAWRETAKLWCGLALDSTDFINALFKLDPVTALECLADAKRVTPQTADSVIDYFKDRLGADDGSADAVAKALGAAAIGNSPRNRRVFAFLVHSLSDTTESRRRAAAAALSITNAPEAAEHLAGALGHVPEADAALVRMGDLAVSALEAHVSVYTYVPTIRRATRALAAIGTPRAVEALVRLLWFPNRVDSTCAALALGSQLHLPQVESAMRSVQLPPVYRQEEWYRWVWAPFEEGESTMAVVAGRIGYLIDTQPEIGTDGYTLDRRVAIPLLLSQNQAAAPSSREMWQALDHALESTVDAELARHINTGQTLGLVLDADEILGNLGMHGICNRMNEIPGRSPIVLHPAMVRALETLFLLPVPYKTRLLSRLTQPNQPTLEHWRNIFRPVEFKFEDSFGYFVINLALFALPVIPIAGLVLSMTSASQRLLFLTILVPLVLAIMIFFDVTKVGDSKGSFFDQIVPLLLFSPLKLIRVGRRLPPDVVRNGGTLLRDILLGSFLPVNVALGSLLFGRWLPIPWVLTLWGVLLGPLYLLYWLGERKDRRSGNPLVGLLDKPIVQKVGRMNRYIYG